MPLGVIDCNVTLTGGSAVELAVLLVNTSTCWVGLSTVGGELTNGVPGAATPVVHPVEHVDTVTVERVPAEPAAFVAVTLMSPAIVEPGERPVVIANALNCCTECAGMPAGRLQTSVLPAPGAHVEALAGRPSDVLIAAVSNVSGVVTLLVSVAVASSVTVTPTAAEPSEFVIGTVQPASAPAVIDGATGEVDAGTSTVAVSGETSTLPLATYDSPPMSGEFALAM